MPTGTVWPVPQQVVLTNTGIAAAGAQASFYLAGTSTSVAVYSDVALSTALTQPVVANAGGRFPAVYLTPGTSYKVVVSDSAGVQLYTQDNIAAIPASTANSDISGTTGEAITAGQWVYLSDGSGAKTAGQWYRTDATNTYSSTTPVVGIAPNAIASGAVGTIRTGGQITSGSYSVGTIYYLSGATAGAVTSTAPVNSRIVGQADSATSIVVNVNPAPVTYNNAICEGRLTLTSGTAVTTADVTGATSVYFAPYAGNRIALYDGTATWNVISFTETTLALGTLTNALPYDIFGYNNAGTLALELLAWTNNTTRATALVTQNGVLSKTGALTRRYLGTFYTTSTTQTEDSAAKRFLWNYYHRVPRSLTKTDTGNWNYTTSSWRQANANTANQVAVVVGWAEIFISVKVIGCAKSTNAATPCLVSIGLSGTSPHASTWGTTGTIPTSSVTPPLTGQPIAFLELYPAVGYQYYTWLEWSGVGGTTTWYALDPNASNGNMGIFGELPG